MTAATATAPRIARERLEDRWSVATTRALLTAEPDGRRSIARDNSKDFYRWEEAVVAIAMALRGDHLNPEELEQVENIAAKVWDENLRTDLLAWAEEHAA